MCKFMFLQFFKNSYSFFHFVVVLNDSSSHIFSYNLCWQILVLHFCSFIFFYWNDKRERGPRRAWAFTWLDIVLLALWESDTRTGRVCSAVGRGDWRVTNVRTGQWEAGNDGTCRIDRQDRSWRARELEMPRQYVSHVWLVRASVGAVRSEIERPDPSQRSRVWLDLRVWEGWEGSNPRSPQQVKSLQSPYREN